MHTMIFVALATCGGIGIYNFLVQRALIRYVRRTLRDPSTGIMKGAEPIFLKGSSKKAALLIHGFIGSPTDFAELPVLLNQKGLTVSVPLLPGHGTDPRHFSKTTAEELEQYVLNAYRGLKKEYEEVVLIGFSMGGALSILTAAKEPVDKLVLLEPYLKIAHQWYYILSTEMYTKVFMRIIPYVYRPYIFKQLNRKTSLPYIVDYDFLPLKGAASAIELGRRALEAAPGLKVPTLVIHSRGDRATDFDATFRLAEELKQKTECRFVGFSRSNHMILWDYEARLAEKEILEFVR